MNRFCKLFHNRIRFTHHIHAEAYAEEEKKVCWHSHFTVKKCPICAKFYVKRKWSGQAKQIRRALRIR
jgi:hypothetical protein